MWRRKKAAEAPANRWADTVNRMAAERAADQKKARETQVRVTAHAPHWPHGSVGRFYVKKDPAWGDAHGLMAVEQLPLLNVRRIDSGFVLLVGEKGQYLFEVDHNGESAECVPWDDEMEREFELHGEDIPPTYDMPEPVDEPEPAVEPAPEVPTTGIMVQTDAGLYTPGLVSSEPQYPAAFERAREIMKRDGEEARQRQAQDRAGEATEAEERARQEAGK